MPVRPPTPDDRPVSYTGELHRLHALLYEPDGHHFREGVMARFEAMEPDLLVLDYVVLSPKWRKLKLGLLAVRRLTVRGYDRERREAAFTSSGLIYRGGVVQGRSCRLGSISQQPPVGFLEPAPEPMSPVGECP